jgi:hypothetical protein
MLSIKFWVMLGYDQTAEKDRMFRKIFKFDPVAVNVNILGRDIRFSLVDTTLRDVFELLDSVYVKNQYDVSEMNVKGKTVVDAGACIGDFAMLCAVLGAKKVYAFEPDEKRFGVLSKNISDNMFDGVIIPVCIKLWQKPFGTMATTLDIASNGEKVDFIKMDVEGDEIFVLFGAKKTIQKYKPILSFSAYHRPTDKQLLPATVRNICPEYKITLNNFCEEDFYCEARK